MSRRAADDAIAKGRVLINEAVALNGQQVLENDVVRLDGALVSTPKENLTIALHKPVGYVCSRNGQGSRTIYDLLPKDLHNLKPVGRLDKDSSGLILLTNDGEAAHEMTHPSFQKTKIYHVTLDKPLAVEDKIRLSSGVKVENYISHLGVSELNNGGYRIEMTEGKNRQIRKTFSSLGYRVTTLHRTHFGIYSLADIPVGHHKEIHK